MELVGKIILASQSPRRKELLKQIGLEFECIPSDKEEKVSSDNPEEVVKELSKQKAEDIASKSDDFGLIIGADTVVSYGGRILGKPKDIEEAKTMLSMLQSHKHQVYTGVTLILPDKTITFSKCTDVYMYPMSESRIENYVATGEPMDKAGAYAIQGKCAAYVEKIEGDYNNVVGLPVAAIVKALEDEGIDIKVQ